MNFFAFENYSELDFHLNEPPSNFSTSCELDTEAEFINTIDHFTQIVAALDTVLQFAKNLPDLIFDGVSLFGINLEFLEVRKEFMIDEIFQVIASSSIVINFPITQFRRCPD